MENEFQDKLSSLTTEDLLSGLGSVILNSIRDPFGIISDSFEILWANKKMAWIHNCVSEEYIGKICYQVFYGRNKPCHDCSISDVYKTGRTQITEKWAECIDGKRRYGEVRAYPVRGENKAVVAAIVIVIETTEKREDLEKQKQYNEYLTQQLILKTHDDAGPDKNTTSQFRQDDLTTREIEVLRLITEGYTNKQISELLSISSHTVKSHVVHIFNKLGVNDRTQAAVLATKSELI